MTPKILTKPRHFGITFRIALLTWLIALVTLTIFVVVIIPEQKRIFVENLTSKANAVAISLQDVTTGAVVNEDYTPLVERCLQLLKGDKSIDYLVITKNSGESWMHDKSGWRYSTLPAAWHPETRVPSAGIGVVPEFNRRVFHYSQPFDYSDVRWGWIHVGLSLAAYDQSVATVYRRTILLALGCTVLSLLASAIYARFLVRPIMTLQSAVHRIAKGDLSARAVVHSGDEIELLANSFNGMAGSLLQRDHILGSVQFASQQFLAAADWRTVAMDVLNKIGQAAETSRTYIHQNHTAENGSLEARELFEWPATQNGKTARPVFRWAEEGETAAKRLQEGLVYSAARGKSSPAEQSFLDSRQAQALVLVPIRIDGIWWGHLGFDDSKRERSWTDAEIDSLRALADMLGAAIARQRVQDALIEAKYTLEQRVSERTCELQKQVGAKEKALSDLAEIQQELIVASREAGMAEVATGVLHNVGNVLNSVNVSATLIREKVQRSEVATLAKLRILLQEHETDAEKFLTTDPKGKMVPGFIIQLSQRLEKEQVVMAEAHDQLARNVEHIKEIVAMQQNYARVSGFLEPVSVAKLMDDALQMNVAGLTRHGITIVRQYSEVPVLIADKHKILQILVNLVHNAKYALDGSLTEEKKLTVGLRMNGEGRVQATVADNGVGIPVENLTRIFSHGFTTRKNGHGFGLHSGANAAKEMGGQLTVQSAGAGTGAVFTLELPLHGHRNN